MDKNKKNIQLDKKDSDLATSDHVRVSEANYFKKGTEPRWSDEVMTRLTSEISYSGYLRPQSETTMATINTPNVVKVATKQHKQDLILKAEDIKNDNIRTDKRERVANKQMSDFIMTQN